MYLRAQMAVQDERGALVMAHREGQRDGLRQGLQAAVLAVLAARGLPVDAAARERVGSCADVAILEGWLAAAAVARSTEDALNR